MDYKIYTLMAILLGSVALISSIGTTYATTTNATTTNATTTNEQPLTQQEQIG